MNWNGTSCALNQKKSYLFKGGMLKIVTLLAIAASGMANAAGANSPVPLLGLSLGGKFPQIKVCSFNQIGSDKTMCWVDQPFVYKGQKSGTVNLPNSDARPKWAAHAGFHITLNKSGELDKLDVRSANADTREEIMKSLEARFGLPTTVTPLSERIQSAEWKKPPVFIRMLCSYSIGCKVEFSSVQAYASLQSELSARAAKDSARPISP